MTTLVMGVLAFIFLITTLIFINKYKTTKQTLENVPKIKQLTEKTPKKKDDETDLQYLKRCAMRFQNEIAIENVIVFTEDEKMHLNIMK